MNARLTLGIVLLFFSFNTFADAPISHISINVIGEDGLPIEDVTVQGYFSNLKHDYIPSPERKSITDVNGNANISGPAYFSVNVNVTKEGYYESKIGISVNQDKDQNVSILLRAKRNPIPMYAKHFKGYIPKIKVKVAFDFSKGDWVSPYGEGISKDIYFYYDGFVNSFFNYEGELSISFPNESDGMVELEYAKGQYSKLKFPYMAPENGYKKTKLLVHKRKGQGESAYYEKNLNKKSYFGYFFRVRSEDGLNGNASLANYIKIGGEIIFDPRSEGEGEAYLEMTYYLNPIINDRNLEFDTSQNLFKNLKHSEKVGAP